MNATEMIQQATDAVGPPAAAAPTAMQRAGLVAQMDAILARCRGRMNKTDDLLLGLRPTEVDWATSGELAELHQLQLDMVALERQARGQR